MSKHSDLSAMSTCSRLDLIKTIAVKNGYSIPFTRNIVNRFLDEIIDELGKGNRVEFRRFGVFKLKTREGGYKMRNPRTNEIVGVRPKHKAAVFQPSSTLKELLNGRDTDESLQDV